MSKNKAIKITNINLNNLRNVDLEILFSELVSIAGVSGSGKSTLVKDCIAYISSKRHHALMGDTTRNDIGDVKQEVSYVNYLEQGTLKGTSRSLVGTALGIIQDLRKILLPHLTVYDSTGDKVLNPDIDLIFNWFSKHHPNTEITIIVLLEKMVLGPVRNFIDPFFLKEKKVSFLISDSGDTFDTNNPKTKEEFLPIVCKTHKDIYATFKSSLGPDFYELLRELWGIKNKGLYLNYSDEKEEITFSLDDNLISMNDPFLYIKPTEKLLSFNSRGKYSGACRTCAGSGKIISVDKSDIFNEYILLPLTHGGVNIPYNKTKLDYYYFSGLCDEIRGVLYTYGYSFNVFWKDLSDNLKNIFINGSGSKIFQPLDNNGKPKGKNKKFIGIYTRVIDRLKGKSNARLDFLRKEIPCPVCKGTKFNLEARAVGFKSKRFYELFDYSLHLLINWLDEVKHSNVLNSDALLLERIRSVCLSCESLGIGHLSLSRTVDTLSGGEAQRLRIGRELWDTLIKSTYILDEPSRGLHHEDIERMMYVLRGLAKKDNAVILVEHNEQLIKASDRVIELGPGGGDNGGIKIYDGDPKYSSFNYLVEGDYRKYKKLHEVEWLCFDNVSYRTIKEQTFKFPLGYLSTVTGVSGSGKSTLVLNIVLEKITSLGEGVSLKNNQNSDLSLDRLDLVHFSQSPLQGSFRSKVISQLGLANEFREWFYHHSEAKQLNLTPSHFSSNTSEGMCLYCEGKGVIEDIKDFYITCSNCNGSGFSVEITFVEVDNKNIIDWMILPFSSLTVNKILPISIIEVAQLACELGLGHLSLGRAIPTLSGGESQRIKIMKSIIDMNKPINSDKHLIFMMDEPTSGLHYEDIKKLLDSLQKRIISKGHTVIAIEHNLFFINNCDWIVEMGPGGAEKGGKVIFNGSLKAFIQSNLKHSATYRALLNKPRKNHHKSFLYLDNKNVVNFSKKDRVDLFSSYLRGEKEGEFVCDIQPAYAINYSFFYEKPYSEISGLGRLFSILYSLIVNDSKLKNEKKLSLFNDNNFEKEFLIGWPPCVNEYDIISEDDVRQAIREHVSSSGYWFDGAKVIKGYIAKQVILDYRKVVLLFPPNSNLSFDQMVQRANALGRGVYVLFSLNENKPQYVSSRLIDQKFMRYGVRKVVPEVFEATSDYYCCSLCLGKGKIKTVNFKNIFSDKEVSIESDKLWSKNALEIIRPYRRRILLPYINRLKRAGIMDFSIPFASMNTEQKKYFLYGFPYKVFLKDGGNKNHINDYYRWHGINSLIESNMWKGSSRKWAEELSRSMKNIDCPECHGSGLGWEAMEHQINSKSIYDILVNMEIYQIIQWVKKLTIEGNREANEIKKTLLNILVKVNDNSRKICMSLSSFSEKDICLALNEYRNNNRLKGAIIYI